MSQQITQDNQRQSQIGIMITQQMGGQGKLKAMLGAYDFFARGQTLEAEGGLQFRFKGSAKANYVEILLAPNDTYIMRFFKIKGFDLQQIKTFEGVYCDQLIGLFEKTTGLRCSI